MFDKKINTIRIFIYENVMLYPPTINLIESPSGDSIVNRTVVHRFIIRSFSRFCSRYLK